MGLNPVLYLKEDSNLSMNLENSLHLPKFFWPIIGQNLEGARKDLLPMRSELKLCIGKPVDEVRARVQRVIENMEELLSDVNKFSENLQKVLRATRPLRRILMYIKQYDGYSRRMGKIKKVRVCFYDEKEWRYVPNLDECMPEIENLVQDRNPCPVGKVRVQWLCHLNVKASDGT